MPLQHYLLEKKIPKMKLVKMVSISPSTAAKMWKGEYIAMKIVDDICNALGCELTDVIEHIPDPTKKRVGEPLTDIEMDNNS